MGLSLGLCSLLICFTYVQSAIVLGQSASVTKNEGEHHKLSCSVAGFNLKNYYMHWFKQVPGKGLEWFLTFYNPTDNKSYAPGFEGRIVTSKDSSTLYININGLKPEDSGMYYCARTVGGYGLDYWGQGTMVTVLAAIPSPPSLYVSSCEQTNIAGSVTYGCLVMDYSPEISRVSWKKDQEMITTGLKTYPPVLNKEGTHTLSSQLTITESEVGSSTIYCEVHRGGTVWKTEIPVRVVHHPTVLLTMSPNEEIISSRFATVICSIINFHPNSINVKWLKNGQAFNSGIVNSPASEVNGNFSAISRLTVPAREWFSNTVYTCQVTHEHTVQNRSINRPHGECDIGGAIITLLPPPAEQVLLEATVTLTCVVTKAPYGVNISWFQERKLLKSEIAIETGALPESVVSKVNVSAQAWLSRAQFHCVGNHQDLLTPLRNSINKENAENPRQPSVFVLLPSSEDVSALKVISLSCLVSGFFPRAIFVKWTVNDQLMNPWKYKNTEVVAENGNSSFFMYSLLSLAAEEWASGASYSCVVGHETIPLKIMTRTVNISSGKWF